MIHANKVRISKNVSVYGEREPEEGDKVWWRRTFNWTDEICRCYRHRGESGGSRRCAELGVIEITDPGTIDERRRLGLDPLRKTFCPGCWHKCRSEVAVQHPEARSEQCHAFR